MKKKLKQKTSLKQITYYLISGGAYFATGYIVFFICDKGLHLNLWWAKLSANIIGWIINYILQRYWVFNNKHLSSQKIEVTYRYVIITAIDFVIDYLIVRELKTNGLTPYLGQFVSAGFFTVWNYYWYKYWVFPNKSKKSKK
jgi:putative flippase GtrA